MQHIQHTHMKRTHTACSVYNAFNAYNTCNAYNTGITLSLTWYNTFIVYDTCATHTGFVRRAVVGAVVTSTSVQVASNVLRTILRNGACSERDRGVLVSDDIV